MEGVWRMLSSVFGLLCSGLFIALWLGSIIWAAGDADRRGKSGCLVALLVFLLPWPVGLIAWLVFRPRLPGEGPL